MSHENQQSGNETSLNLQEKFVLSQKLEKINLLGEKFFTVGISPPKTEEGMQDLMLQLSKLKKSGKPPLFSTITRHHNQGYEPDFSSINLAEKLEKFGLEIVLNTTIAGLKEDEVESYLEYAHQIGIKNFFAIRGDVHQNDNSLKRLNETDQKHQNKTKLSDLKHASDLVKIIRKRFGDEKVIGVGGYPMGHPDAPSYEFDLEKLKEKVETGADFIITQICFSPEVIIKFIKDCRKIGITVPIIPGILPIQNYETLMRIADLIKVEIPERIKEDLLLMMDDEEKVSNYGIERCCEMIEKLFRFEQVNGVHFFTLNKMDSIVEILNKVGL